MQKVYVRTLDNGDFESLTELIKELGYPSTLNKVSDRLVKIVSNKNYKTFVAKVDEQIVGFIGLVKLYAYEFDDEYVRITALIINEKYRRRGIGTSLLKAAEKWSIEEGAIAIGLNSGINRKEAHEFYKSKGYDIKGYNFSRKLNN